MEDKKFGKSVRKLNVIKHLIGLVRDDNKKIQLIEELARTIAYRTRGIYADEYLEKMLCKIGSKIEVDLEDSPRKGTVLHVLTQAGIMGGHTRVVDHWIQLDSVRKHSVVITSGAAARKIFPQFLKDTIEESGGNLYFMRSTGHISRARQLLEIAQRYDKIVLHTYMEDSIPALAFSNKKWRRTVYFFNHANFRFWLGTSITDVCLDITSQDAVVSKELRGIKNIQILPVPMLADDQLLSVEAGDLRQRYGIEGRNKVVTTMANCYKYQTISHYNFFDFLDRLLHRNKNIIFFAIGPDKKEEEWERLCNKYPKRLRAMGILDKDEVNEILKITDLYVGSFPLGSGTACLDAAVMGVKVVSLKTDEPFFDSLRNRAETVEDLITLIEGLLDGSIEYIPDDLQAHLKEGWMRKLESIYNTSPPHRIYKCKSKNRFGKEEKILMCGLDKEEYRQAWTWHGELPMFDLDEKEYVMPLEMSVWRHLFNKILWF